MKKAIVFRFVSFMVLLSVVGMTFGGCSSHYDGGDITPSENNELSKIETEDYSIIEDNGSYYIIFADKAQIDSYGQSQLSSLEFDTIQDFKDAVTKGLLADWQKATIATAFPKNEIGVLSCDFNNLYVPIMPSGGSVTGVSWEGESYSYYLQFSNEVFGFLHRYTAAQYNTIYQSEYEDFFDRDTIIVKNTEQIENGQKTATYYSTSAGELLQVRYTLENESNIFIIDKTYRLNMGDETIDTSSTIPFNITLYCQDASSFYVIDLFGFAEDPSDDWLMQFGMTKYVDKSTVDK